MESRSHTTAKEMEPSDTQPGEEHKGSKIVHKTDSFLWREVQTKLGHAFGESSGDSPNAPAARTMNDTDILLQQRREQDDQDAIDRVSFALGAKFLSNAEKDTDTQEARPEPQTTASLPDAPSGSDWSGGEELSTNSLSLLLNSMQTRLNSITATPVRASLEVSTDRVEDAAPKMTVQISPPSKPAAATTPRITPAKNVRTTPLPPSSVTRSKSPSSTKIIPSDPSLRPKSPSSTKIIPSDPSLRPKSPSSTKLTTADSTSRSKSPSLLKPVAATTEEPSYLRPKSPSSLKLAQAAKKPQEVDTSTASPSTASATTPTASAAAKKPVTARPSLTAKTATPKPSSLSTTASSADAKPTALPSRPSTSFKPIGSSTVASKPTSSSRAATPTNLSSTRSNSSSSLSSMGRSQSGTRLATSKLSRSQPEPSTEPNLSVPSSSVARVPSASSDAKEKVRSSSSGRLSASTSSSATASATSVVQKRRESAGVSSSSSNATTNSTTSSTRASTTATTPASATTSSSAVRSSLSARKPAAAPTATGKAEDTKGTTVGRSSLSSSSLSSTRKPSDPVLPKPGVSTTAPLKSALKSSRPGPANALLTSERSNFLSPSTKNTTTTSAAASTTTAAAAVAASVASAEASTSLATEQSTPARLESLPSTPASEVPSETASPKLTRKFSSSRSIGNGMNGAASGKESIVGDAYVRRTDSMDSVVLLHPSAVLVECKPPPTYMPSLLHSSQVTINAIYNSAPNSAMLSGATTMGFVKAASTPKSAKLEKAASPNRV